jgi:citronellol/citronellal dehydrogenase
MRQGLVDYTGGIPLQRFGTEAEISAAIVSLLSPAAAYINGFCIRVDGGAPNSRQTWTLQVHNNSKPFEVFHRSKLPEVLELKS